MGYSTGCVLKEHGRSWPGWVGGILSIVDLVPRALASQHMLLYVLSIPHALLTLDLKKEL